MLRILYRACGTENHKYRPSWYSKALCLQSIIDARRRLGSGTLMMLCDGNISWLQHELSDEDEVVLLHKPGNAESLLQAMSIAVTLPDDDVVYFVEDDYLHTGEALVKLRDACEDSPGDYFTLYDHPDRYLPPDHRRRDAPLRTNAIYLSRSHHWRTAESTCMTFAARVRTVKQDLGILMAYTTPGRMPQSRYLFRHVQGLAEFATSPSRRLLLGPIPSLATHCEQPYLAPHVDWHAVALDVAASGAHRWHDWPPVSTQQTI